MAPVRIQERHLTTARAEQIPKYGQIRTESRLFRAALQSSSDVPVLLLNQPNVNYQARCVDISVENENACRATSILFPFIFSWSSKSEVHNNQVRN